MLFARENEMRSPNQRRILNHIRQSPCSRAALAEATGLTRAAITMLARDLTERGFIHEAALQKTSAGRRPVDLALAPDARVVGGVNIRRGGMDVGFVNLAGDTLCAETLPLAQTPASALAAAAAALASQRRRLALPARILGVGACAPGPLDHREGRLLHPPQFETWHDVPVATLLSDRLDGLPVWLDNVSNALAMDEGFYGMAKGADSYMVIQVNEGIGAGVVTGGKLHRGAHGLGSELGHISIRYDGPPCACGNRGCLECYAAIPAILYHSPCESWASVVAHADESAARALVIREADCLSAAIVTAINLFDVQKVILKSDIARPCDALRERIRSNVAAHCLPRAAARAVEICFNPDESPVRVAAMPCLSAFFLGEA